MRRDVLLSFAAERIYRPLWSTTILEELELCEVEKLADRGIDRAEAGKRAQRLIALRRRTGRHVASARAIEQIASRSGRSGPQMTFDDVLDELRGRYGLNDCVHLLEVGPRP